MERMNQWNKRSILRMIYTALLTVVSVLGGGRLFGIFSFGAVQMLTAAAALFVLTLWDHFSIRGRMMGLAGALVFAAGAAVAVGLRDCLSFFQAYAGWLVGSPAQRPEWGVGFQLIQILFVVLLCYLLRMIMEMDFHLQLAGAAAMTGFLFYALFMEKTLPKICVALVLCYVWLTCVEWNQIYWKKKKGKSTEAYMLWLMPFATAYFLLLMVTAVPEEPYDWQIVKNLYRQLCESLTKVAQNLASAGNEDYEPGLSGFSGRGQISGGLQEDDREIMRISDSNGLVTNVYLSGKVYDTFDGREWKQTDQQATEDYYLDTIETMYALRTYDNDFFTDYLRYADFQVEYRYFHSAYLFLPPKTMQIIQNSRSLMFRQENGSVLFDRAMGYGTKYEVAFYQMNGKKAVFDRFLEEAGQVENPEILSSLLKDLKRRTGTEMVPEALEAHRQSIYEHYLDEVQVSDETYRYLEEITLGAETKVEKLRAIENELNGFSYTLSPGKLPERIKDDGDFLDYFLLEGKRGYCSHFATAFTLLARREGIPARYVQGFCVPIGDNGEAAVYSHMAHAWPEVYFDGIGWIPFEPTPGYTKMRYSPWMVRGRDTESAGGAASGEAKEKSPTDALRHSGESLREQEMEQERADEAPAKVRSILAGANAGLLLRLSGVTILSVLCVMAAVLVLSRLMGMYRYRRMREEEKLRTEVQRNLQILALLGMERQEETLEEFRLRAERSLSETDCLQFLQSYEETLYGSRKADAHMLEETIRQQESLLDILKKRRRGAYFYWLLFLTRSR